MAEYNFFKDVVPSKKKEKSSKELMKEKMEKQAQMEKELAKKQAEMRKSRNVYEDGGIACEEKKKKRLAALAKLAKLDKK